MTTLRRSEYCAAEDRVVIMLNVTGAYIKKDSEPQLDALNRKVHAPDAFLS